MSDSSYATVTRHRKPFSTSGRPEQLDVVDDAWAADTLSDDEIECDQEVVVLDGEGDLDVDAVVSGAAERRRKEENRWNDLGLDQFDQQNLNGSTENTATASSGGQAQNDGNTQQSG